MQREKEIDEIESAGSFLKKSYAISGAKKVFEFQGTLTKVHG